MPFETHGFLSDERWYEDLGHVGLGLLPIDLLLYAREWTTVRLPWPFKGQWPPGKPWIAYHPEDEEGKAVGEEVTQLSRVADKGRDTLGYAIGQTIRAVATVVAIVWLAL